MQCQINKGFLLLANVHALLQEWLDIYHGAPSRSESPFGQSGLLQQALILQMSNDTFNALHVDTIGWNGQLPMLDLYYLVKRLTENGLGLTLSQVISTPLLHRLTTACMNLERMQSQLDSAEVLVCGSQSFQRFLLLAAGHTGAFCATYATKIPCVLG